MPTASVENRRSRLPTFEMDGDEDTSGNALIERDNCVWGQGVFEMTDSPKGYETWLQQL